MFNIKVLNTFTFYICTNLDFTETCDNADTLITDF